MKYSKHILFACVFISLFAVSCKHKAAEPTLSQQYQTTVRHDLRHAMYSDETIMNRAVSQDEWQDFKIQAENKLADVDIQIALIDRSAMPADNAFTTLYLKQLDSLQLHNDMMKSSIAAYNERQSEWGTFMHAFEKNISSTDLALQAFLPR